MTDLPSEPVKFVRSVHAGTLPLDNESDPPTQHYLKLRGFILQECADKGFDDFQVITPYDVSTEWGANERLHWRFGFEAFGARMYFYLMGQGVENLLVNIRICIDASKKAREFLDADQNPTFLVEKHARYTHGVFGIHADLDAAIQHCKECAYSDSDGHHEWSVLLFNGKSEPASDAERTMLFECSKGDWAPEDPG